MRLDRLALSGFSPAFPGVVDLPLRDLDPGLVAIVGENGAGKTTLLETVPGGIYRQMPSNDGADPVTYATSRESFIEEEFTFDRVGTFRARLNLDGPKRATDAALEEILADGTRVPLNPKGQRSTYDEIIKEKFPSFDLFMNSSFAAQGRGDEFTRRKPSQRKDLFAEFLGQQHYAVMAKAAADAVALAEDSVLRLTVQIETLERDTAPAILDALDGTEKTLLTSTVAAKQRQRELGPAIADLETRLALLADQVAANAAAAHMLRQLEMELALRRGDRAENDKQQRLIAQALKNELTGITEKRDADVKDVTARIGKNQQVIGLRDAITAAVAAVKAGQTELAARRTTLADQQAAHQRAQAEQRDVERAIALLVPVEHQVERAERDARLLETVPCGGAGEYAACQFLQDATAAKAKIAELRARLEPKAALADRLSQAFHQVEQTADAVHATQGFIAALEARIASQQKHAQLETPLAEATVKIAGYEAARDKANADAEEQCAAAQRRHDARLAELQAQASTLETQIATLTANVERAGADLQATAAGNTEATRLQWELSARRQEWDSVVAAVATATNGQEELARRREELEKKQWRLEEVRGRLARVQQELVEWTDLAKALSKGGLPDLEIDAAGPTISALANELLLACFGARFTLELVTQVAKADGSGAKDNFTVLVTDNETGAVPRDIRAFSGGQRTILQEALMCAITLYVNERSPMPIRTLWRDETGAALDPANAIRYVQMLRKVRVLGGFHHVYFISHNSEAAALADAQIRVGGGTAVIVRPPFEIAA